MDAKCNCPRTSAITLSCNSEDSCKCPGGSGHQPICINSYKLEKSIEYSSSGKMGSSRQSCLPTCYPSRRLNRSYSEQKIRCLLTTTVAFCLGISVGALLPFVFPPVDNLPTSLTLLRDSGSEKLSNLQVDRFPDTRATTVLPVQSVSAVGPVSFVNTEASTRPSASFKQDSSGLQLVNGIYWSDWVEDRLPKGFSANDITSWQKEAWNSTVSKVESGCGRMQNRLVTYTTGNQACCRYRQNFDQIQGEIFSFFLSRLLGIQNLVPSSLDVVQMKSKRWESVRSDIEAAQWANDRPVVVTQFINNLSPAYIPQLLRSSTRRVHPTDIPSPQLLHLNENSTSSGAFTDISELAQWSDLIIFDYLTANLDRMVNNLYNLQWNPTMMEAPAHNLAKQESTGLLIFLDNESGLLHGYRLLDKYEHYHRLMLDSLCVFRKSTVSALQKLRSASLPSVFKSMLAEFNGSQVVPMLPDKSVKILSHRIDTVYRQVQKCQSLYNSRNER